MRALSLILLLSSTYAGCARHLPATAPGSRAPVPKPVRLPFDPILFEDTVVALAADEGEPARLADLGRRTLAVYDLASGGARRLDRWDLSSLDPPDAPVARHAVGCVAWTVGRASGRRLVVRSTALDEAGSVEATFTPGRNEPEGPPAARMDGACSGFRKGIEAGSPGRAVCTSENGPCFYVDSVARLRVLELGGDRAAADGPYGEPLAARGGSGAAVVLVSSASLPGEPDLLVELGWDGSRLEPRGRSAPFDGKLLAAAFLERADAVVIAEAAADARSILRIVRDGALGPAHGP